MVGVGNLIQDAVDGARLGDPQNHKEFAAGFPHDFAVHNRHVPILDELAGQLAQLARCPRSRGQISHENRSICEVTTHTNTSRVDGNRWLQFEPEAVFSAAQKAQLALLVVGAVHPHIDFMGKPVRHAVTRAGAQGGLDHTMDLRVLELREEFLGGGLLRDEEVEGNIALVGPNQDGARRAVLGRLDRGPQNIVGRHNDIPNATGRRGQRVELHRQDFFCEDSDRTVSIEFRHHPPPGVL